MHHQVNQTEGRDPNCQVGMSDIVLQELKNPNGQLSSLYKCQKL